MGMNLIGVTIRDLRLRKQRVERLIARFAAKLADRSER
jgi:hypothetical protein